MKDRYNNYDFSKKYPGITEEFIKYTIESVTEAHGSVEVAYLATKEKQPRCLIFRRVRTCKFSMDKTPDEYMFSISK